MAAEVLYQIIDKKYPSSIINLAPILEGDQVQAAMAFDQSRKPITIALPFSDGEYDPFGDTPWPLNGRDITFMFAHKYDLSTGENFTKVFDQFSSIIMSGRPLTMVWKTSLSPPTFRYGEGKGVAFPRNAASDHISYCVMQATIHMTQPLVQDQAPNGWATWDSPINAYTWDQAGLTWDNNPDDFSVSGTAITPHNITNLGTADDNTPTINIYTPAVGGGYPGPIYVWNYDVLTESGNPWRLVYNGSLGPGQTLSMELSVPSFRLLTGSSTQSAWPNMVFQEGQDGYFKIKAGLNHLFIQAAGSGSINARCQIIWTQRYF